MLLKIIFKNLIHKPLATTLSVSLLALSTGIISLLLVMQHQLEQKFERDLRNIDLVVGAKGSPLQLVLSAVYHVDAPTGNIPLAEVEKLKQMRSIAQVIPLAYGDSYQRFRILGTDTAYIGKYDGRLNNGRLFEKKMEVVLGAAVASNTGLQVGQRFYGTHGEAEEGEQHHEAEYVVVGVLEPSNTVLDNLLLTPISSVWGVHEHVETAPETDHDHGGHDHDHDHEAVDTMPHEVTAALIKARSTMAVMTLPRMLNETTNLQATIPALEINRLMKLLGIGVATLQALAVGIMLISGFSVFIALYNRLRERKYELALMRSLGCGRFRLFGMLLMEGLLLALAGFLRGLGLSRSAIWLLNNSAAQDFHFILRYDLISNEAWLLAVTLLVGMLAAFFPAVKAFRMNLSTALADA
ncbi:MAG: ABC transporter permease [Saprospiraceae bacterium]|nr:ABC transporter permease [Saprospiraceae bacterium]